MQLGLQPLHNISTFVYIFIVSLTNLDDIGKVREVIESFDGGGRDGVS